MTVTRYQIRRNFPDRWNSLNPILLEGEQGYEEETGKFKIGDGKTRWRDLDYFISEADVRELIAKVGGGGTVALTEHINSETPHAVYDDGPSFLLLYLNAKV